MGLAESQPRPRPAWQSFVLDLLRTLGDYVLFVLWGTVGVLILSTVIGYLPYSDRPGPGWLGAAQTASLSVVWFFLSWAGFAAIHVVKIGLVLFVVARVLRLIRCPRWAIRVIGALVSGFLSLYIIAGLGWYIAVAEFPVLAAGLLGVVFGGFFLLPRDGSSHGSIRARHVVALAAPVLIVIVGAGIQYVRALSDQRLELVFVKWDEQPQDLALDEESGIRVALRDEELDRLRSVGLRGRLTVVSTSTQGSGPASRMVVVMKAQPTSPVTLRQPDKAAVIYVQNGDQWTRYPSDVPVLARTVELSTSPDSPHHTVFMAQLASGAGSGGIAAIW